MGKVYTALIGTRYISNWTGISEPINIYQIEGTNRWYSGKVFEYVVDGIMIADPKAVIVYEETNYVQHR